MNGWIKDLRAAILAMLALGILVCAVYPAAVTGIARTLFAEKARGSLLEKDGKVIGSKLLGQTFTSPQYFHSRPSGAGKGYDAASSSGTNLGPTSAKHLDAVKERARVYRELNGFGAEVELPADAVTASASGLDPHISVRNAELQLARVARERGMTDESLRTLVAAHTEGPFLGLLGEAGVNVMTLNLALDARKTP